YQIVRSLRLDTGADVSVTPLLGRINAVAAFDVNGDGVKDLIVGGESGTIFALNSRPLTDPPQVLWRQTVGGPVRQIYVADLDGDGRDEIVVAATHAITVLDAQTGAVRYTIPLPNDTALSV